MPLNASALAFINRNLLFYSIQVRYTISVYIVIAMHVQHLPDVTVEYSRRRQLWHYQQCLHDTVHILYYDTGYYNVYTGTRQMNMYVHKLCNIQGKVSFYFFKKALSYTLYRYLLNIIKYTCKIPYKLMVSILFWHSCADTNIE